MGRGQLPRVVMSGAPFALSSRLTIELPDWVVEVVSDFQLPLLDDAARMALTVRLSEENVARGGGPFGSTVFLDDQLLAAGVNLVLTSGFSIAHAEIVALMGAQATLGGNALSMPKLTLFASTEPCCQCFGALVWAGVRRLVCAATTGDAEAVGFDEGPKPDAWLTVLENRGIAVTCGVLRAEAKRVLDDYAARGGPIYGKPTASSVVAPGSR
jgi:tRNA(Arg) A34 adenosine deaminase TadA